MTPTDAPRARKAFIKRHLDPAEDGPLYDQLEQLDGDAFVCGIDPFDGIEFVEWADDWSVARLAQRIATILDTNAQETP